MVFHFLYTVFQPLCPKPVALPGVIVAKVQDPAFGLVESHPIDFSSAIQTPLQGLATPRQIDASSQLGVICKLTEGALSALIQVISKDIEEDRPQARPLGNTTRDWSPAGFYSIKVMVVTQDLSIPYPSCVDKH